MTATTCPADAVSLHINSILSYGVQPKEKTVQDGTPVAIVTGGGAGIGRACLLALAEVGYSVVCADVSDTGSSAVEELVALGHAAHFIRTDMSQPTQIAALFAEVSTRYGRVDVLVNSAGVTRVIDVLDVTTDDWDSIININARGTLLAMQAAARMMEGIGGGSIVNIGSISAKGFKETSNIVYASSKAAVVNMTRIAATRCGPMNIRVNCVCPGMTKTEMWSSWIDDRAAATGASRADLLAEMSAKVPLQRLNEPSDVAAAVLFFATDMSRTITGQSLNVDGGTMWD